MTLAARLLSVLGAINGALVVALGAYGAHALKGAELSTLFQTAILYHLFHSLGLLTTAAIAQTRARATWFVLAGAAMLLGIVLFCGSLYAAAISGEHALTALAPVGGSAFIVGWLLLAFAAWRR
jgi:uncharacterized membrane protein YgdD (TMEM256/DUF423 family)